MNIDSLITKFNLNFFVFTTKCLKYKSRNFLKGNLTKLLGDNLYNNHIESFAKISYYNNKLNDSSVAVGTPFLFECFYIIG